MIEINEFLKYLGFFTIGSISITGLITYIFNKLFEHKLAKISLEHQIRFSRIYNDQADQWRVAYKDLVIAERDLELLLRPITFNPQKSRKEVEDGAVKSIRQLFDNFDENKILFEDKTIVTIEDLRNKFIRCCNQKLTMYSFR